MSWLDDLSSFFSSDSSDTTQSSSTGGGGGNADTTLASSTGGGGGGNADTTLASSTGGGGGGTLDITSLLNNNYSLSNAAVTGGSSSYGGSTGSTVADPSAFNNALSGASTQATGGQSASGAGGFSVDDGTQNKVDDGTQNKVKASSDTSSILSSLGINDPKTGDTNWGSLLKGAIGAGGLAYTAVKNSGESAATKAVEAEAKNADTQGAQLESYLSNGTLPPGAQQYVNQQTAAQKASILSKYASMGMSGSTAEAQELANADTQAQSNMFKIASELYQNGVSQTNASTQLYSLLMNQENQDNTQMSSAISTFISSLGGSSDSSNKTSK